MDLEENGVRTPDEQNGEAAEQPRAFRDFKSVNPVKPVKSRRVGTLTLGAALVVTGILLLLNAVLPDFPLYMAARLSPLILILIGVEILVASLRSGGEKLRYDFLSMIVCFFLICGSLLLGIIPQFAENMVRIEQTESRISRELEEDVYEALRGQGIEYLSTGFYLYDDMVFWTKPADPAMTYSNAENAYVTVSVTLSGSYETAEEFAAAVRAAMDALAPLDFPSDTNVYFEDAEYEYNAGISNLWEWDYTAEQIAEKLTN